MSVALHLYQQLRDAPDEGSRAKIIATAFEQLEDRYPNLKNIATVSDVRESELCLKKEIKELELRLMQEIKEIEGRLQKEMHELEGRLQKEIQELEGRLQKEIKQLEIQLKEMDHRLQKDIHTVELKIIETKSELVRWVVGVGILQTSLLTGVLLKIAGFI